MPNLDLSVVIPAYLEEENLRIVLPRLLDVLRGTGLTSEIVVVDTEKPLDNTSTVCLGLGAEVVYCSRAGGNNYGDAVRTGIAKARGERILFMDADGSHSPEFIPRLLSEMENCDVVIASRYTDGGTTENPASLIWMSRFLNSIFRFVLRIPCRDVSNSFKLYRAEMLKPMPLECEHFDIVEEVLVRCMVARPSLRIVEVPFVFKARMFGVTKRNLIPFVASFLVTLGRLMLIRLRARRYSAAAPTS